MSYAYCSHKKFANDLLEFAKNCDNNTTIGFRMMCGRLYYAMYHKILADNNHLSQNTSNIHSLIKNGIRDGAMRNRYKLFYDLRSWADYDIQDLSKPNNRENLINLCQNFLNRQNIQCQSLGRQRQYNI